MKRIWSNKYVLIVNAISIMVAFLTHFPELITLSNPYSADGLSFPGMHWADVGNEVLFTYLSLLFLFFLFLKRIMIFKIFRYNGVRKKEKETHKC